MVCACVFECIVFVCVRACVRGFAAPAMEASEASVGQQVSALLVRRAAGDIVCVTREQNLVVVDAASLALSKTLVGYNDDIIDARYVPSTVMDGTSSRQLVVATNSDQVGVCVRTREQCRRWPHRAAPLRTLAEPHALL